MKNSKRVLLLMFIGLFIGGGISTFGSGYSTGMQSDTENWLTASPTATVEEEPAGGQGISSPTPDPTLVPVGHSLLTIVLLSGLYLLWRSRNRLLHRWHKPTVMLVALLVSVGAQAQAPDAFRYQAAVRDAAGALLCESTVDVRFKIHRGTETGAVVFSETHRTVTSAVGTVSLQVGRGTDNHASLSDIVWSADNYFLETEIDRGSGYTGIGVQQLLSVPYASQAATAKSVRIQSPNGKYWDIVIDNAGNLSAQEVTQDVTP
jgi:hypothetical protein